MTDGIDRMTLTPEEKADRVRDRMIETAKQYGIGTLLGKVAKIFQEMIRAEAGAIEGYVPAIVKGKLVDEVWSPFGMCVCVTCSRILPWRGTNLLDTGHFMPGISAAIVLDIDNVAPQCRNPCNFEAGKPVEFRLWMESVRGQTTIDRLESLKHGLAKNYSHEELVDLKIEFMSRNIAAQAKME